MKLLLMWLQITGRFYWEILLEGFDRFVLDEDILMQPEERPAKYAYLLFGSLGLLSWLGVNSLWVELPIFLQTQPEQYQLPSYLIIVIQLGNLGPLLATLIRRCRWTKRHAVVFQWIGFLTIFFCILIGNIIAAFLFNQTANVAGNRRSVGLFVGSFLLGVGDCLTNVVFLPYLAGFASALTVAFFIGQGLSGLVPSLVGLAQGAGEYSCHNLTNSSQLAPVYREPQFSVSVYFVVMLVLSVLCMISYFIIERTARLKQKQLSSSSQRQQPDSTSQKTLVTSPTPAEFPDSSPSSSEPVLDLSTKSNYASQQQQQKQPVKLSRNSLVGFLLLNAVINALGNSFLLQIQPFTTLPYGKDTYALAVRLSVAVIPLACLISFVYTVVQRLSFAVLSSVMLAISVYLTVVASVDAEWVPFHGTPAGSAVTILLWVIVMSLFGYVKVCVASVVQSRSRNPPSAMFWLGLSTQIGSFLAAVLGFVLINVLRLFSASFC